MGERAEKYCDMCAAKLAASLHMVRLESAAVDGHEFSEDDRYNLCEACHGKMKTYLDKQRVSADAAWEREAPTSLTVKI